MFSLKYIYDRNNLISEGEFYNLVNSNSTYSVYENKYSLNIVFPVSDDVAEWDTSSYSNPVDSQDFFFELATGVQGIYNRITDYEFEYNNVYEISDEDKIYENFSLYKTDDNHDASLAINLTSQTDGHIYIYVYSRNLDNITISSPTINTSMKVSDGFILDLGYHNTSDNIRIDLPMKDDTTYANIDFIAFTINTDKFVEGYEKLKAGQIEYIKFDDTKIEGTFVAEHDEILFSSIPYDKGWNVYIDGKKVSDENIIKISDALLGVKVSSGEHNISFEYSIPGLKSATIVSVIFIILLIVLCILKHKKLFIFKNAKMNIWEKADNLKDTIIVFNDVNNENLVESQEMNTEESIQNQDNDTTE